MDATEICPLTRKTLDQILATCVRDNPGSCQHERRKAPRWPFPGAVELWKPGKDGAEEYVLGTCVDLSMGGVGFRVEEAFQPGQQMAIAIHQPAMSVHGRGIVRHCRPLEDEFYVGMEFVFDET